MCKIPTEVATLTLNNPECFNQAKSQIISLLDKIIAENPSALMKLVEFKDNLIKLENGDHNYNRNNVMPLLTSLKRRLESLYYYNRHLLKNVQEDQFADLTLDKCYPGAYSNALMLIDRVTAGDSINSYLLSAKREFIQQQAASYIAEINIEPGSEIHAASSLYNYVAPNYNIRTYALTDMLE
ncbi:hypothetical protein Psal006b_03525 (plasmid) [Piscirickettsia salmonis]|nr:hypothetical protein [Piscirickettsia salmonis]QGO00487.1 hypothetical protein Psal006b_03525 [Piscirickettsia salmonis]